MRKYVVSSVLLVYVCVGVLFLLGCGAQNPLSTNTVSPPVSENVTSFFKVPADGVIADTDGDISEAYCDIVTTFVDITAANIVCRITLSNLPATLTFNHTALAVNALEYQWSMFIDTNDDDVFDYQLAVMHFKSAAAGQLIGGILANTQRNMWKATGTGGASNICAASCSITGNEMTISVLKSANSDLVNITEKAKVRFVSSYNFGGGTVRDELKNQ